ncbi:MAG: hypothetical protein SNJ67_07330 [Chloracidobacterium sp.]
MSYEHLKASWRAEVEAIVRAELGKMESEIARMHHQVEQSFTQLLSQSAARLAAVSHDAAIADFAERALSHLAVLSPASMATETPAAPPDAESSAAPPTANDTPPTPDQPVDLQALYHYIVELQGQHTQADVLNLLVMRTAEYAPRVALFVVKSGNVVAWAERGFEATGVPLRGLMLPLQAQTTLLAAVEQQTAVLDSPYAYSENQLLLDRIGNVPEAMAGIPLMVRGKAAAVLYADTGEQPVASITLAPLQILVNVAGLTVELLNARNRLATTTLAAPDRTTQTMDPPAAEPPPPPTVTTTEETKAETQTEVAAKADDEAKAAPDSATPPTVSAPEPPADEPKAETESTAQAESPVNGEAAVSETYSAEPPVAPPFGENVATLPPAQEGEQVSFTPFRPEPSDSETSVREPSFEPVQLPPVVPPGPTISEPTGFDFTSGINPPATSEYTTPADSAEPGGPPPPSMPPSFDPMGTETPTAPPSNGVFQVGPLSQTASPPAPPVAVSMPAGPPKPSTEEETKAHNDARRFARLLVSEIKLYNEAKVIEGRTNRDLYDRLKEDIDRSRQMYDKRVNPIVAAKYDYFYDELVSSLAEGDSSRLGADCPGPILVQLE